MSRAALSLSCLCWATLVGMAAAQPSLDPGDPGMVSMQNFSGGVSLGGTYFSISNQTGDGVGYRNGFTQFGMLAPYWINEDLVLAGNGRLTIGDSITVGGSLGGFLRYYNPTSDRIYGANAFFDLDESVYNNRFKQAGFGVESLGRFLDFRANGYVPTEKGDNFIAPIGLVNNDLVYFEHRVGFLGLAQFEESLSGGDFEFGVPVSPQATWLRAYAGMYAYQAKQNDPVGFRGRLEGWVSDDLSLGVQVTDDRQFGTNVNAQVNFLFSGWKPTRWFPDFETRERILSPVQRNWRIATGSYGQVVNVPLYNPRTQQPYFLTWVDNSNVGGGDGTVEDPFPVMPPVAPEADMILVRRGISSPATPVLGSIQLLDYQRLLGEGREHTFLGYANFGPVNIPVTQFNLPGFENTGLYPFVTSPNSIVSLADNNEVSAFTLFNSGGAGITNTPFGSENFNINYVNLTNNAGGGIALTQASGQGLIHHVNALNNTAGGIGLDSGATPLNLTMFEITSDSNPAGTQAFGISINADNGPVIADLDVIRTDDNDAGIILTETNSSLTASLTNIRSRRSTVGDGILAAGVGGTLNLQLDDVIATGNAGRGVYVTGDNTDIQFTQTDLDARGNTNNNVEFALINSSTLFGGLQDIDVSNSTAGSGLVLGAASNSQIGSLANPFLLLDVTSDNNALHGLNVQTATSGDVFLGVVNSNFNDNDLDGFHFDLATGSVLRAGFDTVNLDDNARSAVLGTVAGASTLDLVMTDLSGQRSGANGMFITSTTGSNVFVDLTDANFSDSDSGPGAGLFSGIRIDATDSNVDLNLLRTTASNTAAFPAGTQDFGLQLNFAGATQFAGSVTDSFFDNNIVDGVFVSAAGTSNGRIGLVNVSAQDNGQDGFDARTTGAGVTAIFDLEDSFFNGNGLAGAGNGLQFLSTDATLGVNLINTQGDDNASSGLFMDFANTTAVLTALDSSFSGNGDDGVFGNFAAGSDVSINTFENVTGDDNDQHGLNLTVTGVGSTLNGNINGGSFSDNGVDGVNVQALAGGAGLLCFDGTDANGNTDDGFDFNSTGAGSSLAVLLQTSGNFTQLQATGNGDQAVAFNVGPGASGFLFMDGDNLFSPNNAPTPIVYTATGAAQAAFEFSGTSSNNAGHGLQVNLTDVAQAWLDIHDATLNGNAFSGVEINLDNVTFAAAALTASFIQGDFTMQPFQIVDSDISNNITGYGIELNGIDVRLPFVNNARHIDGNTVNGNNLDNIFVSLNSTAQLTNIAALNISNNSVSDSVNGSGLRVEVAGNDTTIGTLAPLRGLTLNNNIANDNDNYGVFVNVQDNGTVSLIRINNTDTTDPANWSASGNGLDGVLVQANAGGANTPTINNIQINGPGDATGNGGFGINVLLTDVLGSPTISINGAGTGGAGNRTVNNNGQPGIGNTLINTPFTSVTISNNIVDPNQGGGIITSFENSSGNSINITDNSVLANIGIGVGVTLTDNSDITTINLLRNIVDENVGNGIDVVANTNSDIVTLNINENGVHGNQGHGINLDLDAVTVTNLNILSNRQGTSSLVGLGFLIDGDTNFTPFSITNTSDPGTDITDFSLDILPSGHLWDTVEPQGSTAFQPQAGTETTTGLLTVNGNPFPNAIPGGGVPDAQGLVDLSFNDFNAGETFSWLLDADPLVGTASIFGNELIGSTITVNFSNGQQLTGGLFAVPGNPDASQFVATGGTVTAPGIDGNTGDGIHFEMAATTITNVRINDNGINNNEGDAGINFATIDASTIGSMEINDNEILDNDNGDGIRFGNVINASTVITGGNTLTIDNTTISGNGTNTAGDGIDFGDNTHGFVGSNLGPVVISNSTITENNGDGVRMVNPTMANPDVLNFTFEGTVAGGVSTNNISGNAGNGINFELTNGEQLTLAMTGTSVGQTGNGNGGMGLRLITSTAAPGDASSFNANIGNSLLGAAGANTFTGNTDAGIGIIMTNDTQGSLIVENTVISGSIDGADPTYAGVGLGITLTNTAELSTLRLGSDDNLQDTGFNGNAGDGIQVILNDDSTISSQMQVLNVAANNNGTEADPASGMLLRLRNFATVGDGVGGAQDLLVQDTDPVGVSSFSGNRAHGLRIERLDNAGLPEVTIQDITFDDNVLDGISLLHSNGVFNQTPTVYTITDNIINENRDGIALDMLGSARVIVDITGNEISNQDDNGIRIALNQSTALGNPVGAGTSRIDGNTFTNNGNAAADAAINVQVNAGDNAFNSAYVNLEITGTTQRQTITGGSNGIIINNNSTQFNAAPPAGVVNQNTFLIQGLDIDAVEGNGISMVNSGVNALDTTGNFIIGGPGAGEDVTITEFGGDGIAFAGASADVLIQNTTISHAVGSTGGDDGIAMQLFGNDNITIRDTDIRRSGGDGIDISDNGAFNSVSIRRTVSNENDGRGLLVNIQGDGGFNLFGLVFPGSVYNVGDLADTGANRNSFSSNGLQGMLFLQRATNSGATASDISAALFLRSIGLPGGPNPALLPRFDTNSPDNLITLFNIINNDINSNGNLGLPNDADGSTFLVGTNTRMYMNYSGNGRETPPPPGQDPVLGNLGDDFRIASIVSTNPFNSIDNTPNTVPIPAPDTNGIDEFRQDPVAHVNLLFGGNVIHGSPFSDPGVAGALTPLNYGEQINVSNTGFAPTGIAGVQTQFTNADVFKGTNRSTIMTGEVYVNTNLNNNIYSQNGVVQDISSAFGSIFTLSPYPFP